MAQEYVFEHELREGVIVRRNSQFTMEVLLNGETVKCHCPATTRIGDMDAAGLACLVSESDNPNRKLKYTVEAISCDPVEWPQKNWVGINLVLSNRLVEFLLETHQLDEMVSDYDTIRREVKLGISKLDFLVGNTYLEVKTPLTTIDVVYGPHVRTKKVAPFSSTGRFQKHIRELAGSLQDHERAILLTVNQYRPTDPKPHLHSTHYQEIKETMAEAVDRGIETWNIDLCFTPHGVSLLSLRNTTRESLDY